MIFKNRAGVLYRDFAKKVWKFIFYRGIKDMEVMIIDKTDMNLQ